jgi:hypothetical protein
MKNKYSVTKQDVLGLKMPKDIEKKLYLYLLPLFKGDASYTAELTAEVVSKVDELTEENVKDYLLESLVGSQPAEKKEMKKEVKKEVKKVVEVAQKEISEGHPVETSEVPERQENEQELAELRKTAEYKDNCADSVAIYNSSTKEMRFHKFKGPISSMNKGMLAMQVKSVRKKLLPEEVIVNDNV